MIDSTGFELIPRNARSVVEASSRVMHVAFRYAVSRSDPGVDSDIESAGFAW
jgi:hypothetical protein